jgi:hypothetical protein
MPHGAQVATTLAEKVLTPPRQDVKVLEVNQVRIGIFDHVLRNLWKLHGARPCTLHS